ncbi:hypothetical protein Q0812_10105 [Brevundimonas sp. 2R-24]|uniref:Uncharacterized protein n=1 Tax=Peiella sedimenti TaxID=3061083 RepID=A0ABT8SQ30_9CAUL|nr:hypothetical protein [Caulobacteraceae bacterium XZ-24]
MADPTPEAPAGEYPREYEPTQEEVIRGREQGLGVGAEDLAIQNAAEDAIDYPEAVDPGQGEDDGVVERLEPGDPGYQ